LEVISAALGVKFVNVGNWKIPTCAIPANEGARHEDQAARVTTCRNGRHSPVGCSRDGWVSEGRQDDRFNLALITRRYEVSSRMLDVRSGCLPTAVL